MPAVQPFVGNPWLLVVAISAAVAAMRFLDPVGFLTIAAFFLPLSGFMAERGVPPLVLTAIILLPVHVFWFNYQNIWIVMTEGISKRSAYTDADRFKLASAFFGVTVVALLDRRGLLARDRNPAVDAENFFRKDLLCDLSDLCGSAGAAISVDLLGLMLA